MAGILYPIYAAILVGLLSTRFRVFYQVGSVLSNTKSATIRFRLCNQVLSVPSGSECATRLQVSTKVKGVLINRFSVCYKVQGLQPGT